MLTILDGNHREKLTHNFKSIANPTSVLCVLVDASYFIALSLNATAASARR